MLSRHWLADSLRFRVALPGREEARDRGRGFRIAALLAVVFVLHAFDLALTNSQLPRGNFVEANVLAAVAVASGSAGAATYKALLVGAGTLTLYACRRHPAAEVGAWGLSACGVALMVWWSLYLDNVEVCLQDPAVCAMPLPF